MSALPQNVAAMLPMVLEFLEEHGFKKTAAVFKEESKAEKPMKLVDLFEANMKKRKLEQGNGAEESDDDDDDDDECAYIPALFASYLNVPFLTHDVVVAVMTTMMMMTAMMMSLQQRRPNLSRPRLPKRTIGMRACHDAYVCLKPTRCLADWT